MSVCVIVDSVRIRNGWVFMEYYKLFLGNSFWIPVIIFLQGSRVNLIAGMIQIFWSVLAVLIGFIRYAVCYRSASFFEQGRRLIMKAYKMTKEQYLAAIGDCATIHKRLELMRYWKMGSYIYFTYIALVRWKWDLINFDSNRWSIIVF